jgi:hypothetical protein
MGPEQGVGLIEHEDGTKGYRIMLQPPCECRECAQQYRSIDTQTHEMLMYTVVHSDDEAQQKALELVLNISRNRQYLTEQCELNGDAISKRWKKTAKKREIILLQGKFSSGMVLKCEKIC